jgi:hypothetical protein
VEVFDEVAGVVQVVGKEPLVVCLIVPSVVYEVLEVVVPPSRIDDFFYFVLFFSIDNSGWRFWEVSAGYRIGSVHMEEADMEYGMDVHGDREFEPVRLRGYFFYNTIRSQSLRGKLSGPLLGAYIGGLQPDPVPKLELRSCCMGPVVVKFLVFSCADESGLQFLVEFGQSVCDLVGLS